MAIPSASPDVRSSVDGPGPGPGSRRRRPRLLAVRRHRRCRGCAGIPIDLLLRRGPLPSLVGRPEDVAYDIGERRFERVFRSLSDRGFDIGLHASYAASGAPDRLIRERERLQSRVRTEIIGVRHHYWQVGAGRAGDAARPRGRRVQIRHVPCVQRPRRVPTERRATVPSVRRRSAGPPPDRRAADVLHGRQPVLSSDDTDAAVTSVDRLVDEIVRTGGSGVIDWHIQTSLARTPGYGPWGRGYERILEGLAARSDVWVTDLESMADWVARRREVPLGVPSATELAAAIR